MYAAPLTEEAYRELEEADAKRAERLLAGHPDGPLERAIRENERTSILEFIVTEGMPPVPNPEAQ
jgi:hypothetical protein